MKAIGVGVLALVVAFFAYILIGLIAVLWMPLLVIAMFIGVVALCYKAHQYDIALAPAIIAGLLIALLVR